MEATPKVATKITARKSPNFLSVYANHCTFEGSHFDLKLILGILDQQGVNVEVEQHTALTVSWIEAKLIAYFLQVQIAVYEEQNGKVKIPKDALPGVLPPLPEELKDDPTARKVKETLEKMREEFIANNA